MDDWSLVDTFNKTLQVISLSYNNVTDKLSKAVDNGNFIGDSIQLAKDITNGKISNEVTEEMWARNHPTSAVTNQTDVSQVDTSTNLVTGKQGGGSIISDLIRDYMKKFASLDDDGNSDTVYLYDIVKDGNVTNYVESKFPTIKDYSNLKPFAQRYKEMKIQFSFSDIVAILVYFRGKYGA